MLMRDLSIIVRQMRVFAERNLASMNIGFPEQVILMYLTEHECMNQEQIAAYFEIDKGAVAKTLDKLEEKALISRHVDPSDKRKKLVALSAQAEELLTNMGQAYEDWSRHVCFGISVKEMAQLEKNIAIMAHNSSVLIGEVHNDED